MGKLISIAPSEPKTGYTTKKSGDEHCSNCEHFEADKNECNGPHMIKLTQKTKLPDGNVQVSPHGWCKFWENKDEGSGKKEK